MSRNLTQVAGSYVGTMEDSETRKHTFNTVIHITEKQTGKILDYIPLGEFWEDNHHKSLKDTLEYFEFRTFGDKRYSQYLEKMNRIIIPDEDGTFVEFVIFHATKYRLQSAVVVDVYAPASYLLLKKAKVINPQRVSEYTASQHLGFALSDTEWRPGIVESGRIRTLDIENHTNPYAYIRRIANEFELEPRFRVETDGNKVIGRYVDLLERVGEWQGREVEFGRDLLGIERKVDDSNVVTALIGLGPERDDGTRLEVFVEDEEALQRWGIPNPQTGELMHLIETYEPESTDQNMSIERLTELTRNELEKRINSVVEYTTDIADLEKVPGMENKIIRFGDTIKIKDTGFNPPLYLEARVHTQDRSLSQPEKKKVTLGDFIEYTEEEVHAIWKQLQSEVRRRITAKQLYDYTYSKLIIDNKDDEVRTDVETYARTVAADAKNEAITYTNNTLEPIAVRIDNVEEDIENHQELISKAQTDIIQAYNEIELRATKVEVNTLSGRVNQAESQITQLAGQIELRATKTEVDALSGRVSTVESEIKAQADEIALKVDKDGIINAINVSTEGIKIMGDKINLVGAVNVLSDISGNLGTINSGVINSVTINGSTINSRKDSKNYTTISQNHIHSEGEWNDTEFGFGQMYGIFDVNNGNISMEVGQVRNGVRNIEKAVNVDFTMMGMAIRSENNGFYINNIGAISWGDWFDGPDSKGSIYPTYGEDAYYNITPGFVLDADFVDIRQIIANGNARQIAIRESDTLKQWHIEVNNENLYIAETNVAVRLTLDTNGTLYTSNDIIFGNNTGRLVNDGGYGYLQTVNSEYRVTKFKSTTYIPIRAASFPSGSLEEYKTNIEKWEGSALEIIRSADIYKYQLKSDIADGRYIERYGLVIGEGYRTPKEFIDGDGIEQYAMNSINMKAIQELDKEQQDIKGRIAWLEAENELLREKIKKLEGMIA